MANDNRLFLRDFGVFGDTVLVPFRVLFGCFRLLLLFFAERIGVFVDFFLGFPREQIISNHQNESMTIIRHSFLQILFRKYPKQGKS